jgi:hypothetical protein
MRYIAIRDIVPLLKEIGISHVQFPPIQTTRVLSEYDGELLRNQVYSCKQQLQQFNELCLKAQEKSKLHPGHTFDHVLRSRIHYINQPTLRAMHTALSNGILFSELLQYTYNEICSGSIISPIAFACIQIGFIGKKHPMYSLYKVAEMVIDGIDPAMYSEDKYKRVEMELEMVNSIHKEYSKDMSNFMKQKLNPPDNLLQQYSENKIKFAKLNSLKQTLLKSKELYDLLKTSKSMIQELYAMSPSSITYIRFEYDPIKFQIVLNCIYFYEFILYPPWWLIYQPTQLEVGDTFLGTRYEIYEAIQTCKLHSIDVIVDIVVNNLAATAGERNDWIPIVEAGDLINSQYEKPVMRLKQLLTIAFGSDALDIVTQPHDCIKGQEPTECWMSLALPQLNQSHPLVVNAQNHFLKTLADLGVDGIRIDAAAHISPEHCKRIIDTFHTYRGVSNSISYVEYLGGSESWRNYKFPDYEHQMRLEDFDIGESLYMEIFAANADLERTKNFANKRLKRYINLDSIVMLINHDHVMGSIPSKIYMDLPSKATYDLSLSYLIQRVYGHVLIMPHDISSDMIIDALHLRKQMRECGIVREYVDVFHNSIMLSYKFDSKNTCMFISAFNLHASPQTVMARNIGASVISMDI